MKDLSFDAQGVDATQLEHRRRQVLLGLGAAALTLVGESWAQATFPTKPVRTIVPHPAGQAADVLARMLAERLSAMWGQQVIVDNKPGGGGLPAMIAAKAAKADGYTLVMGSSNTHAINPSVHSSLPYDTLRDFVPLTNIAIAPFVLVAHPAFPVRSLADVVAAAKRDPGKIHFASTGPGSATHLTGELFKSRAGIDLVHVPYKGSGPGVADLIGGQIPLMFDSVAVMLPFIRGGQARPLAVTTLKRVPQLPDLPTIAELGFAGFESMGWAGMFYQAGTPAALVSKVAADMYSAISDAAFKARLVERGMVPDARTPESFTQFIRDEIAKWRRVATKAKVSLD